MGKKQHQSDKMYLTATEWKNFFGGKKDDLQSLKDLSDFRRLPFYCCCLSFQPFTFPYCSPDGTIFDLENIIPFLKKYGKNPVNGEKLEFSQLLKLNFHKNAKDEFHCPVTYKVFNENTVIAVIKTTGNVFCYDAIEELNIKANYLRDLLTDEPFTRKDIIKLQDPLDLTKFNMQKFHHLKLNLKWDDVEQSLNEERKKDPNYYLRILNSETKQTLDELNKTYPQKEKKIMITNNFISSSDVTKADIVNSASYSTGRVAASLTCTVMDIHTVMEPAKIDENEIRWSRVIKKGKKGYVCLVTNFGRINIELFCDQVPRTCENFLKHCLTKYYSETKFHRLVKNFMIQGGDPSSRDGPASGLGGQSIWGEPFEDEFKTSLTHSGRGMLSMANAGPKTNKSQFFITFKSCTHLDNVHTVFGKIVGGMDVLSKMEAVETDKKAVPKESIIIEDCLVFTDPYAEVDQEIKDEREKEKKQKLAEKSGNKNNASEEKKSALDSLKVQRAGVGKYLSLGGEATNKRQKQVEEDEEEKIKKFKATMGYNSTAPSASSKPKSNQFSDFSSW